MTLTDYIDRLNARYNQPLRPHLVNILQHISTTGSPSDMWESLFHKGLLPSDFCTSGTRRFGASTDVHEVWPDDRPQEVLKPTTIAGVLAVAADPDGMLMAESYARDFVYRLAPWSAVCNDCIVWYFTVIEHDPPYLGLSYDSARDTVNWTLCQHGIDEHSYNADVSQSKLPSLVQRALSAWNGWQIAVERNLEILEPKWPLDLTKWRRFSDLENPFQPLLDLWCTGYRIISNFESDPTIRLYAKPVSGNEINKSQ